MNYSQDIKLKAGEALYCFEFLAWDTSFFRKKSYLLNAEHSVLKPSEKIRLLMKEKLKNTFVTAKIDVSTDREETHFLQAVGFRYIETQITLKYCRSCTKIHRVKDQKGVRIFKACGKEEIPFKDFGSAFTLTRFHSDVNIPKAEADLLWVNYIKNFTVSDKKHMFIATYSGEIAGVILINESGGRQQANLFFVCVKREFRNKKIGSLLVQEVIKYFRNKVITVGTQAKNIHALNFYIKNGFSIIEDCKVVLHRWG